MKSYLITLTSPIGLAVAEGTVMANVVEGNYRGEGEHVSIFVRAYYDPKTELMYRLPKIVAVRIKRSNIRAEQAVA